MIEQLHIKNFKSIVDLSLDLGRVNLFIGENGCGKSNILEAVAFANATYHFKVNNGLLVSKGVRLNKPELFANAFENNSGSINIDYTVDGHILKNKFTLDGEKEWVDCNQKGSLIGQIGMLFLGENMVESFSELTERKVLELFEQENEIRNSESLTKFMIYSPELSYLRKFEEEGQVSPLGCKGEGLFNLLKSLSKDANQFQLIKEGMQAIDWFEDFEIPNDLMTNEYKILIKDRFIESDLKYFDQRSANEGFLFLLFYIILFSSGKTPKFFAIDNIEASFNPKLCSKLINTLAALAIVNNKQVLLTTHNPATLDGLDLKDPEQRLFVVRRNIVGHTIVSRIHEKPKIDKPMKLSEMWVKGFLGGLPENF